MGWKIIEIDKSCILKSFNNNLLLFDEKKITIPMNDIDILLISNNMINMSINVINDLVNNGVCIILCNNKKLPNSYIQGYKVQKQSHINFEKQLEWNNEYKKKCWEWLVTKKIMNQLDYLTFINVETEKFKNELENVENFYEDMIEAKISNFFFKNLYGSSFNRKKENLINSVLDYGYVILTNMVARSIAKKGLHLGISFFHGSKYTTFPLAYDIVEIFRIIIDMFTKFLFDNNKLNGNILDRQIKSCLLDFIANYKIKIDNNYDFINNAIDKVIDWIISGDFLNHNISYSFNIELLNNEDYFKKQS